MPGPAFGFRRRPFLFPGMKTEIKRKDAKAQDGGEFHFFSAPLRLRALALKIYARRKPRPSRIKTEMETYFTESAKFHRLRQDVRGGFWIVRCPWQNYDFKNEPVTVSRQRTNLEK